MKLKNNDVNFWRRMGWVALAAGVLVRLIGLFALRNTHLIGDPRMYWKLALDISRGSEGYPNWPPGLPYLLAAFQIPFGISEFAARLTTFVLSIVLLLLVRRLLREIGSEKWAAIGLAVLAIYPVMIDIAIDPLTHLPVGLCLVIAMMLVREILRTGNWKYALPLGFILGYGILIRPSSSLVLLLVLFFLWLKTRSFKPSLIAACVAAVVIGVWLVRADKLAGHFVWVNSLNGSNFYIGNCPSTPMYKTWWIGSHGSEGLPDSAALRQHLDSIRSLPPQVQDQYYASAAESYILSHPVIFLVRTINRFNAYFAFDSFTGAYLKNLGAPKPILAVTVLLDALCYMSIFFAFVYAIALRGRQLIRNDMLLLALLLVIGYACPYWISFASPIYHTPIIAIMLMISVWLFSETPPRTLLAQFREATLRKRVLVSSIMIYALFIQVQYAFQMLGRL